MRSKKDEPLSNIGKKTVCVTRKGPFVIPVASVNPVVPGAETTRTASPSTSIEELLLPPIRGRDCLIGRRKRSILARPLSGMMRDWQWTGLTRS